MGDGEDGVGIVVVRIVTCAAHAVVCALASAQDDTERAVSAIMAEVDALGNGHGDSSAVAIESALLDMRKRLDAFGLRYGITPRATKRWGEMQQSGRRLMARHSSNGRLGREALSVLLELCGEDELAAAKWRGGLRGFCATKSADGNSDECIALSGLHERRGAYEDAYSMLKRGLADVRSAPCRDDRQLEYSGLHCARLAWLAELLGRGGDAQREYGRVIALYPGSVGAALAAARLRRRGVATTVTLDDIVGNWLKGGDRGCGMVALAIHGYPEASQILESIWKERNHADAMALAVACGWSGDKACVLVLKDMVRVASAAASVEALRSLHRQGALDGGVIDSFVERIASFGVGDLLGAHDVLREVHCQRGPVFAVFSGKRLAATWREWRAWASMGSESR